MKAILSFIPVFDGQTFPDIHVYCDVFVSPLRVGAWMVLMFGPPSVKGRTHLVRRSSTTSTLCTNPLFNREPQVATRNNMKKMTTSKSQLVNSICEMNYIYIYTENIKIPSYQLRKYAECVKPARMEEKGDMKAAAPHK